MQPVSGGGWVGVDKHRLFVFGFWGLFGGYVVKVVLAVSVRRRVLGRHQQSLPLGGGEGPP